jgi:hypothetical protein
LEFYEYRGLVFEGRRSQKHHRRAFNRELELEKENAVEIDRIRQVVMATVQQTGLL